jgi:hypothetical protein
MIALVFLVYLIHLATLPQRDFVYDGAQYWSCANDFFSQGSFSLYSYTNLLRGPVLPLLLAPAARAAELGWTSKQAAMNLMGAVQAAVLSAGVAPALWQAAVGQRLGWARRLAFATLVFLFWRDYFSDPLSDFPGVLLLLGGLLLAGRRYAAGWAWVLSALCAGVLLGATANIRPVYLPGVLPAAALLWWPLGPGPRLAAKLGGVRLGAFAAGLFLASIPQMLVNHHLSGSWSPVVQIKDPAYTVAGKPNLYLWQLNTGLSVQKYETNIGQDYSRAQVKFLDPVGAAVLQKHGVYEFATYSAYLEAVASQPGDFAALYARHLFNGLDVQYPRAYIRHVYRSTLWLPLLNYTLWFGALLVLAWAGRPPQGASPAIRLVLLTLALPCLASLPIVMECRFLLPLHLLLYALVAFGWPSAWHWRAWVARPERWRLVGFYALFLLGCLTLSATVQANLFEKPRLLNP